MYEFDSVIFWKTIVTAHLLGTFLAVHTQHVPTQEDVREILAYPQQGVFQSIHAAVSVLKNSELLYTKEVQRLLKIYKNEIGDMVGVRDENNRERMPYILVEGDEASGKEKICRRLAHVLNGMFVYSPPLFLSKERYFFDRQPHLYRSAFYAINNYIVAKKVKEESIVRPIISTSGWHHTTTFSLAHRYVINRTELPPPESNLYRWPEDLLMPDIVFYLAFSYKERYYTREFRQAIEAAYSRMKNPYVITIGYCSTNTDVFEKVMTELNRTCGPMLYNSWGQLKHMF